MTWKLLYEASSKTWSAFGRVAFVEAATKDEAWPLALAAAGAEYPDTRIVPVSLTESTPEASTAFTAKRAKLDAWLENTRTGQPNQRGDV